MLSSFFLCFVFSLVFFLDLYSCSHSFFLSSLFSMWSRQIFNTWRTTGAYLVFKDRVALKAVELVHLAQNAWCITSWVALFLFIWSGQIFSTQRITSAYPFFKGKVALKVVGLLHLVQALISCLLSFCPSGQGRLIESSAHPCFKDRVSLKAVGFLQLAQKTWRIPSIDSFVSIHLSRVIFWYLAHIRRISVFQRQDNFEGNEAFAPRA